MSEERQLLCEILERVKDIDKRVRDIEFSISRMEKDTHKMNEHIEFVETVYDVVKKPFRQALSFYYGEKGIEDEKLEILEK